MIDRDRMRELTEVYRGRAAHAKHMAKLQAHADHLKKLADDNFHSEAVVYLASKVLRDPKAAKAARAIEGLHDYYGHMPDGLYEARKMLQDQIWAALDKKWDFHDVHAFKVMMGMEKARPKMTTALGRGA